MIAVYPGAAHPNARRVLFAASQPEYQPLPAAVDPEGVVLTEWVPTAEELAALLEGGHIRLWVWTCRQPLQPLQLEVCR